MRECCSDSERFISTCNDLQEHGRHPKSLQDSLRHRYCVPRCVPRSPKKTGGAGLKCNVAALISKSCFAFDLDLKVELKGIEEVFPAV